MKKITFAELYTKELGMRQAFETKEVPDRNFRKLNLGMDCIGFTYFDRYEKLRNTQDGHEIIISKERENIEKYVIGQVKIIRGLSNEDKTLISRSEYVFTLPKDTEVLNPNIFKIEKEQE